MRICKLMKELSIGDNFFETEFSTEELRKVNFAGRERDDYNYHYCFNRATNDVDYYYADNKVWVFDNSLE